MNVEFMKTQDLGEAKPESSPSDQIFEQVSWMTQETAQPADPKWRMSDSEGTGGRGFRYSPARFFPPVSSIHESSRAVCERYTMSPQQYAKRQGILRQINSVLERWPARVGDDFMNSMCPWVRDLESLVLEVDDTSGDRLERARNWRHLGNAYFDNGAGTDPAFLALATEAYKRADLLLSSISNPTEHMKLAYSQGLALFGMSRRSNLWMVEECRQKYLLALEIAEREMSEAIDPIRKSLESADQVIELLRTRKEIYRRIADLKRRETMAEANHEELELLAPQETDLFELLIANYHGASQVRPPSDSFNLGIDRLMRCV